MSPSNSNKNKDVIKELEKTISPILVVNNSSLKPYVELFEYSPENIYQQPLGCLVGFFEVKEFSDESAYIVNFLTSVLKKEYYINPKRPVTESLDSALHKVNMALSELAKHGNIEWLGKLNAAICVLEKNNTHFSVSGDAKIFLYRSQSLSEISSDLASDSPEPHPLKTFINVSSGRLEKSDRLLITSADIFHILSVSEIKKNFQRFESDKFVQFLKTALSNQMEMIVSIIVEMTETAPTYVAKTKSRKKSSRTANAFSGQSFADALPPIALTQSLEQDMTLQLEDDPEYTDKKTGHIYVQGEVIEGSETTNAQMGLYWDMVKEKITQGTYLTKNEIRKRYSLHKKQLAKKKELRRIEKEKRQKIQENEDRRLEEERVILEIQREQELIQEKELQRIRQEQERELEKTNSAREKIPTEQIGQVELAIKTATTAQKQNVGISISPEDETIILPSFQEKLRLAKVEQHRATVIDLSLKSKAPKNETQPMLQEKQATESEIENAVINENTTLTTLVKFTRVIANRALPLVKQSMIFVQNRIIVIKVRIKESNFTIPKNLGNITPHFSRINRLFSRFSTQQKLFVLGALALIFVAPLFIVRFLNKPKAPTITELQVTLPSPTANLANEKNINLTSQAKIVSSNSDIIATLIVDNNPILITKSNIIILQDNQPKEFSLPADSGSPIGAAYMNDLSLVLLSTDSGKIISFSPISTKFTDNKINLTDIQSTSFIGTYLTYLYVIDQKTNQIYRYPRADGGFGEKTNWLKDSTSLSNVTDMTIDDNIYTVQNNQVLKFFKGQKQTLALEASNTPVHFDKIYTTPELQAIYALDKENSRVIQYSKDGAIIAQYSNEALSNGYSLAVDEKNKVAYISTSSGLISLSIQ